MLNLPNIVSKFIKTKMIQYPLNNLTAAVARWPHGCRRQCSEVAVPALVGSNPTEGGGFFRRKETPPGHGWCVCLVGADGRVVEGRATLSRHHREVSRVRIPGRMASHGCLCCISCCVVQKEKRRREGGCGWPGKVPRSPAAQRKKEEKADRKVPDRPVR
jgi:hypothetical protein